MYVYGLSCIVALIFLLPNLQIYSHALPQQKNIQKRFFNDVEDFVDIVENIDESYPAKRSIKTNTEEQVAKRSVESTSCATINHDGISSARSLARGLTDGVELYRMSAAYSSSFNEDNMKATPNSYSSSEGGANKNTRSDQIIVSKSTLGHEGNTVILHVTEKISSPQNKINDPQAIMNKFKNYNIEVKRKDMCNKKLKENINIVSNKNNEGRKVADVSIKDDNKRPIIFVLESSPGKFNDIELNLASHKSAEKSPRQEFETGDQDYSNSYESLYDDNSDSMSQLSDESCGISNKRQTDIMDDGELETDYAADISDEKLSDVMKKKFEMDPEKIMSEKFQQYVDFYKFAKQFDDKPNMYVIKPFRACCNTDDCKYMQLYPLEVDMNKEDIAGEPLRRLKRFVNNLQLPTPGNEVLQLRSLLSALQSNVLQKQNLSSVPVLFMTVPSENERYGNGENQYRNQLPRTRDSSRIYQMDKDVIQISKPENNHLIPGILVYPKEANSPQYTAEKYLIAGNSQLNTHKLVKKQVSDDANENNFGNILNDIEAATASTDDLGNNLESHDSDEEQATTSTDERSNNIEVRDSANDLASSENGEENKSNKIFNINETANLEEKEEEESSECTEAATTTTTTTSTTTPPPSTEECVPTTETECTEPTTTTTTTTTTTEAPTTELCETTTEAKCAPPPTTIPTVPTASTTEESDECACESNSSLSNPASQDSESALYKKISKLEEDLKLVHEVQNILDGLNDDNVDKRNSKETLSNSDNAVSFDDSHKNRLLLGINDVSFLAENKKLSKKRKRRKRRKTFKRPQRKAGKNLWNYLVQPSTMEPNEKLGFLGVRQPNFL